MHLARAGKKQNVGHWGWRGEALLFNDGDTHGGIVQVRITSTGMRPGKVGDAQGCTFEFKAGVGRMDLGYSYVYIFRLSCAHSGGGNCYYYYMELKGK